MIFFAFSHFLVIIFIINNFCIVQILRQVYSHINFMDFMDFMEMALIQQQLQQ